MLGLGIGLGMGLGIGLGSGFEYFRQYNVIRRIGIRRNGAEPFPATAGGAVLRRWTRDRKVAGSTPGRGSINYQVN